MPALSLRLPDELESRLDAEARREGVARSEVAREAITEYLVRRERERVLAALVAEASAAYGDPAIRAEALGVAAEALPLDNEALDRAERASPKAPRRRARRRV